MASACRVVSCKAEGRTGYQVGGSETRALLRRKSQSSGRSSYNPRNGENQMATLSPNRVNNLDRLPHLGHVSNFCGLKHGPLELIQLLSDQGRARRTGAPIQTGYPSELLLEPSDRASSRRESGEGRKHYVVRELSGLIEGPKPYRAQLTERSRGGSQ